MSKNKKQEYIWHCPGDKCQHKGTIILKTLEPYFGEGKIKCPECNEVFDFFDILIYNKKNVKKYLKTLTNSQDKF